jgi:hypothetical protein
MTLCLRFLTLTILLFAIICCRYLIVRLSGSQDVGNARPQGSRLSPTAISERRIVGSRRCEVPLLVSSIQARAVPVISLAFRLGNAQISWLQAAPQP